MPAETQSIPDALPAFIVDASSTASLPFLRELLQYRELLYFLVWRDIKVRYKQTALGILWALLQPLLTAVVFGVLFGRFARLPSEGVPYLLLVFCGFLPWQLFAQGLNESSNSLVANQRLITKVYFPRLVVPTAAVLGGLLDLVVGLAVLAGMLLYYGVAPTLAILWVPALIAAVAATALGAGLWLSALNVAYRDVRYTLPFLTQFWFVTTPVVYSSTIVPERWRAWLALNPMAGLVQSFRWAVLGGQPAPARMLVVSGCVSLLLLVSGFWYFRRMENTFADLA
jgi:lipopolysaccharide transport system permease protein